MSTLQLPILGNPHGRIFQKLQPGEDPAAILMTLLRRYGDLLPKLGTVLYDHDGDRKSLFYSQAPGGNWVIADPISYTTLEEALQDVQAFSSRLDYAPLQRAEAG